MEKERTFSLTNKEALDIITALERSIGYERYILQREKAFDLADLHTKFTRQFLTNGGPDVDSKMSLGRLKDEDPKGPLRVSDAVC